MLWATECVAAPTIYSNIEIPDLTLKSQKWYHVSHGTETLYIFWNSLLSIKIFQMYFLKRGPEFSYMYF